jgi:hypothetical protein
VKKKQGYRHYTATVGVLLMDGTLVDRAVVDSEFRTERDLYDRVGGGAGPGGVKAVAPTGAEFVQFTLPEGTLEANASRWCGPTAPSSSRRPVGPWPPSAT